MVSAIRQTPLAIALSEYCRRTGSSEGQAAHDAGLSHGYLSELKNGHKENPSRRVKKSLAGVLGVPVNRLFPDEG